MGIGIGGGVGPSRAGISTRGVGGGIGPLSVGTGWGRRRRSGSSDGAGCAYLVALLLALAAVYYFIAWPFLLGAWVAVKLGAGSPSTARTIVGWSFESVWLALLLAFIVSLVVDKISERRHTKLIEAYEARYGTEIARLEREVEVAPGARAVFTGLLSEVQASIDRLPRQGEGRRGTVWGRAPVQLVAPRVRERGRPPVQTAVDDGTVTVTSEAVQFSGEAKSTRWMHKQVTSTRRQEDRLLIDVANRATVMGIQAPDLALAYVEALSAFARGDTDRERTLVKLREIRDAVADVLGFTNQKYDKDSTRLEALRAEHPTQLRAAPVQRTTATPSASPSASPAALTQGANALAGYEVEAAPTTSAAVPIEPSDGVPADPQREVSSVFWGTKAEQASGKAMPTITGWFAPDEHLVAVTESARSIPPSRCWSSATGGCSPAAGDLKQGPTRQSTSGVATWPRSKYQGSCRTSHSTPQTVPFTKSATFPTPSTFPL